MNLISGVRSLKYFANRHSKGGALVTKLRAYIVKNIISIHRLDVSNFTNGNRTLLILYKT